MDNCITRLHQTNIVVWFTCRCSTAVHPQRIIKYAGRPIFCGCTIISISGLFCT